MVLEVDQEDIFPSSGQYSSQQFHLSCPVWFKIITQIIHTDIWDRPNTLDGEDATDICDRPNTSDGESVSRLILQDKRRAPIDKQTERLLTWNNKHPPFGRKENWVPARFSQNDEIQMKVECRNAKWGLCAGPCLGVHETELHFWGPTYIKLESTAPRHK